MWVGGIIPRYLCLNAGVGKASDPDRLGLPAAITLPGPLPLQVGHVSDARAVGRKGAFRSSHQGNLGSKTAHQGNGKKLNYAARERSEEHTSELQSRLHLVCRLLLEKKN